MSYELKIGPYIWEFLDEIDDLELNGDLGLCDFEKLRIKIKKGMNSQIKKSTILHELGHAFFVSVGFNPKEEERVVDIFANQLLSFIDNNKEFFKEYLMEERDA